MLFKRTLLPLLLIATATLPLASAQSGISGYWRLRAQSPDGYERETFLRVSQQGSSLSGGIINDYREVKFSGGTLAGDRLHITAPTWRTHTVSYDGTVTGDHMELVATRGSTTGTVDPEPVKLIGERSTEAATRPPAPLPLPALHDVPDNGLSRTPAMGWNSWNLFARKVDDVTVRGIADVAVTSGMAKAGYTYINIDDTWEGPRDSAGNITSNRKFPDMKALTSYVHSKGLKIGIYSSPGPFTCGGYPGSFGHEAQDAKTYADWGFDYLKYDWCSASAIYHDRDMRAVYQKMGDALAASGRPIVFSLCQYGREKVWTWGAQVGGNSWRTTDDIEDNWGSLESIGFGRESAIARYIRPGHWNDPDMLEVGNGGMTSDEYQVHMTLWSLLAAPLLAGNDLRAMSETTAATLMNPDVIAIDQDPAAHAVERTTLDGNTEIWHRRLADGTTAVALFNRDDHAKAVSVSWSSLGIGNHSKARDLWRHEDVNVSDDTYNAAVARHGVVLLRVGTSSR